MTSLTTDQVLALAPLCCDFTALSRRVTLLALIGAHPVWMSAEWTGEHIMPLAAAHRDTLLAFTAT